jgi:hypothetical protein
VCNAYGVSTLWHPRNALGEVITSPYDRHSIDATAGAEFTQIIIDATDFPEGAAHLINGKFEQPKGLGCGRRKLGANALRVTFRNTESAELHRIAHLEINGQSWDCLQVAGSLVSEPIYIESDGATGGAVYEFKISGAAEVLSSEGVPIERRFVDGDANIQSMVAAATFAFDHNDFGRPRFGEWGQLGVPDWILRDYSNRFIDAPKVIGIPLTDPNGAVLTSGTGKFTWRVNEILDGWRLFAVASHVTTPSTSGEVNTQLRLMPISTGVAVTLLTTMSVIGSGQKDSTQTGVPAVVDPANAVVHTGDEVLFDLPGPGTNAKGWSVDLTFMPPATE